MHKDSKKCIVVLGMHRSGTSSLTRLFSFAGAQLPNTLLETRKGNKSGHWESQKFVDYNEKFLSLLGRSWEDWGPINIDKKHRNKFMEDIKNLINEEYEDKNFIVLKDPRFCRYPHLLAEVLNQLGFSVNFVIISRNPLEVSSSLIRRNGFSEVQSNLLWLRYVLDAEYLTRDFNRTFITFDQIIRDSQNSLVNIANDLNTTWPISADLIQEKASTFINPSLKHHNISSISNEVYDLTGSWFDDTYQILQNASQSQGKDVNRKRLDEIREQLNAATPSLVPLVDIEQSAHTISAKLKTKLNQVEAKKEQNDLELKQRNQDLASLEKERKKFVANAKQHENDINAFKKEQQSLVSTIDTKTQALKTLEKERKKFVANVEQRDLDIAAFKKEQSNLINVIALKDTDISQLKTRARSLKRSLTNKNKSYEKLEDSLKTAENEIVKIKANSQSRAIEFTEKVEALESAILRETALNSYKSDQIQEILNSRSWKILSLPRKLSRVWKNKTLYLVKLLSGKSAKALNNEVTDLAPASNQSASKATQLARRELAESRSQVLHSKWHSALLGIENNIKEENLPNITISAVTFNSEKWLGNFFISVINLDYPANKITLHFVDNGSTDQGVKGIEEFIEANKHRYRNMEVFRRPNKGYGVGNDHGIRQSSDDFVLVTNVDTELYADSLKKIVTVAVNDDNDVACWEFRQTPYEHPKFYDPITLLTNWTSHACVLIRKKAYVNVGGYDPEIFMYGEDVELSYRFRAHGWKLRYVPSAVIKHYVDLEDTTLRPNQLSGSVAANILLRYRFGSYFDILAGEALFASVKANETDPVRLRAWGQVNNIVNKNRWHFFRKRKLRTKAHFPFHEFDYDISRPGAAVKTVPFKNLSSKELPKISIITRTHGKAREHLENVITSVLNQTYTNIEHIIVEDRTDDAKDFVEPLTVKYGNRIKYVKSDGSGRSYCGNYGAAQATGDYLCWLDNDDALYADHIETLVEGLNSIPNAVCSYSLAWDALSEIHNGKIEETEFILPPVHNQPYDKQRLLHENFIPIQAIIFKKSLFDIYGGFEESFSQLEDWNLWTRYAQVGPFAFTPKVTSFYRTPLDPKTRQQRHELLHDAYETVQRANFNDIAEIEKKLKVKTKMSNGKLNKSS